MPQGGQLQESASSQSAAKLWKERFDPVQSALTIAALLAAGIGFFMQEFDRPLVKLEIVSTQRTSQKDTLLAVEVRATNIGKMWVDLPKGELSLYTVIPRPDFKDKPLVPLEGLSRMHLAPGETTQAGLKTFTIPSGYRTLEVRCRYVVPRTRFGIRMGKQPNLEWAEEALIDIKNAVDQAPEPL